MSTIPLDLSEGTTYLLDDHLGSIQMELSNGGWPIWQGQFTPFGQEIVAGQVLSATLGNQQPGDGTNMHYKFTGKERDSESGLDYFGARYCASNVGRWISADWAQKPEAVPYSKLDDPQSLNLYSYVGNNPLSKADADGHQEAVPLPKIDLTLPKIGSITIGKSAEQVTRELAAQAQNEADASMPPPAPAAPGVPTGVAGGPPATADNPATKPGDIPAAGTTGDSKVEGVIGAIDAGGYKVTANPKDASQEGNITITHPSQPGTKLNVRVETHPLEANGKPVRHANVERVEPGPKNRPQVKSNTHITGQ